MNAYYQKTMHLKTYIAIVLLGALAFFSVSLNSVGESAILGPMVRLIPQEIAGFVGASLSQGRWAIPLGFLILTLLLRLRLDLIILIILLFSVSVGRCIAIFVHEPPESLIYAGGEFATEFLIICALLLPTFALVCLISHILFDKEIKK
jgi:hypothetical protein